MWGTPEGCSFFNITRIRIVSDRVRTSGATAIEPVAMVHPVPAEIPARGAGSQAVHGSAGKAFR
jgi:hypothetical protein